MLNKESFYKPVNTRGYRNNNPFNIVKSSARWLGKAVPSKDSRFEQFDSLDLGVRAGVLLLRNYIRKRDITGEYINTIRKIINRFAPISENQTEQYIDYVTFCVFGDESKSRVEIKYPSKEFADMCASIIFYESQYKVPSDYIYTIINQFKLY